MCRLQYWYVVFGISSNVWLNAAIVRELYTMMKMGHAGRRYRAPTHRTVTLQALGAYLWCGFLGTWGLYVPFVPPGAPSGLACVPIPVGPASTAFFWLVFFPLFSGLPTAYVVYVLVDVLRRKLLPPANTRTRLIITYFVRLVVVFFVMWVPTMVLIFVVPAGGVSPVAHFGTCTGVSVSVSRASPAFLSLSPASVMAESSLPMAEEAVAAYVLAVTLTHPQPRVALNRPSVGGLWSHLQGAVSAGISLMKPDIYCAVVTLVTCRSWDRSSEDPHCGPSRCGGEGGGGGGTAACTAGGVDCGVGKRPHPSRLLRSFLLSSRNNAEGGSSWGFGFSAAFLGGSRHAAQQRLETSEDSFSPPLAEPGGTTLNPPLVHGESLTLTGNDMAGRDGGGQPRGDPTDVPSPETLSISFASNVAEELGDEVHVVTGGGLCPDGGDGRTSVSSSGLWPSLDETGDADVDDINDTRHCAYDRDDC